MSLRVRHAVHEDRARGCRHRTPARQEVSGVPDSRRQGFRAVRTDQPESAREPAESVGTPVVSSKSRQRVARTPAKAREWKYSDELEDLHVELVKLQEWIKHKGLKVCIVFEGRDGAGKGGTIKALTERV